MKIIVKLEDDIHFILPRNIRNYIACISNNTDDISIILSHDRTSPELIYQKPYFDSFTIIDCKNRIDLIERIAKRIIASPDFYGHQIKKVQIARYQYTIPVKQVIKSRYYTRTPIIVSSNNKEFGLYCAIKKNNDTERLKQAVEQRINYDIKYQIKCYFGIDYNTDIDIDIENCTQIVIKYKPDIIKSAVRLRFSSSYLLPEFIGYGIGLGWGQIIRERSIVERQGFVNMFAQVGGAA